MKINLLQLSFIVSLFGIFLLLFLSAILQPKLTNISEITSNKLNQNTKISGQIINIRNFPESSFQIINLKDQTGNISITTNQILNFTDNQNITIIGKITEYKRELQIQANKIIS